MLTKIGIINTWIHNYNIRPDGRALAAYISIGSGEFYSRALNAKLPDKNKGKVVNIDMDCWNQEGNVEVWAW